MLAWSNLAAQSAEQLSLAAVPLLAVLKLNAGAGEIGLLASVQTLPFLLFSIPLGLLADRVSRRALMVVAEALRALSLLGLLLATLANVLSIPLLAVLGFVGALGTVGFSVAAPSVVPALVPKAQLGLANGRLELARSLAFASGPALAGALVSWAGASSAFVLATVLSLAAIVCLCRLHEPVRAALPPKTPWLDLREGASRVWHDTLLRPILLDCLEPRLVCDAGGLYSLRGQDLRNECKPSWHDSSGLWHWHDHRRSAGSAGAAAGQFWGCGDDRSSVFRDCCSHNVVYPLVCSSLCRGHVIFFVWGGPNHLDHHLHHLAPNRDPSCDAGSGVRHFFVGECRRKAGGCGTWRLGRYTFWRGCLPYRGHGRFLCPGRDYHFLIRACLEIATDQR
jgi:Major Facilitator Superfamily